MDSIIYKYDLINKELLFKWKTANNKQIILFDRDDKLCTVSKDSVRLWDFEDTLEQPPTIWATEEFDSKISVDYVFINEHTPTSRNLFIVIVTGNTFKVYRDRLEGTNVEITLENEQVISGCFNEDSSVLYLGTSKGQIRFINLQACLTVDDEKEREEITVEMQDPFTVSDLQLPITHMERFCDLKIGGQSVLLLTIDDTMATIFSDQRQELYTINLDDKGTEERAAKMTYIKDYDFTGMSICNSCVGMNSNFIVIGLVGGALPSSAGKKKNEERSALGIFKVN